MRKRIRRPRDVFTKREKNNANEDPTSGVKRS
jgi:hypothetical protein